MHRRAAWLAMTAPAILIAAYATALLWLPGMRAPFLQERLLRLPPAVYAHLCGGALALGLGPFQFATAMRAKWPSLHRWTGRVYLLAILAGGFSGLMLATVSQGGLPAHLGFAGLALLWLGTAGIAYRRIRSGEVDDHRRWMIRNYALTWAAVTLRIYLPLSAALGVPFGVAYPVIAWACWVPNLLLAEWRLGGAGRDRVRFA
jgi:uncharacterized membrane protein